MITLIIALTWACPSGIEHKTRETFAHPKQTETATEKYDNYKREVDRLTRDFKDETCTLVEVKAGHRRSLTKSKQVNEKKAKDSQ